MTDIRIIGLGKMGSSIAYRLAKMHTLSFYDKNFENAQAAAHECGATVAASPFQGVSSETVVLLAIKPQDISSFAMEFKTFPPCKCLVSILTGTTTGALKKFFPTIPILRMMPNLPVRYGQGVVALAATPETAPLKEEIGRLFSPLGLVKWIPEERFDAVTSLTGSGPGFVFVIVEAMVDAAIAMGFSHEDAYDLVKQMIAGSLALLKETEKHPGELKWHVTSPGGTTIQGLRTFEEKGIRSALIETFLSAFHRAQELSK